MSLHPLPTAEPRHWTHSCQPAVNPLQLRIGDPERSQTCELLAQHYALGRLTLPELNERMDAAVAATTLLHLRELTADLPAATESAQTAPATTTGSTLGRHSRGDWEMTRKVWPPLVAFFTACAMICTSLLLLGVSASGADMAGVVWLAAFGASVSTGGLVWFAARRP